MKLNKNWLIGFVDGEGSFYIGINNNSSMKHGIPILLEFRIVQHNRDIKLLHAIKKFFNCGIVTYNRGKNLNSIIMEYRVRNIKHLTEFGIEKIKQLKLKMNRNRLFILDNDIVRS